jgi:DNA-binding NarL/FixJ family response regulator
MPNDVKSRVVLVSHNHLMAEGLGSVLAKSGDFVLAERCDQTCQVERFVATHGAQIMLVDTGTAVTVTAIRELCNAVRYCQAALWGSTISLEFASHAIESGVRGIIPADVEVPVLIDALRIIRAGKLWFTKQLLDAVLIANRHSLTQREGQVVTLLARGLKNKELAYELGIGEGSVKVYLSRLYKKLGVNDRFQLSLYALRNVVNTLASSCGEAHAVAHGAGQNLRTLILPPAAGEAERPERLLPARR